MDKFVLKSRGYNGARQRDLLDKAQGLLLEAEELGFHHCPPGTPEGDHYDRLREVCEALGRMNDKWPKDDKDRS